MPSAKKNLRRPTKKHRNGEDPTGFSGFLRVQNKAMKNIIQIG